MLTIGIDTGGTFTDFVLFDSEKSEFAIGKVPTTPEEPSHGIVQGLRALVEPDRPLQNIIHGTTLAVNAIIERKGVPTGLISTKGFRDVLEIAREKRYDHYDILLELPEPLVPRPLRTEVSERLSNDGTAIVPLDPREVEEVLGRLSGAGIKSIAVSLLHSYMNPAHEREIKALIERLHPDIATSISSEVVPEIREYERTSTTVANAYTKPIMKRYLRKLRDELDRLGYGAKVFVMLSSGGTAACEVAEEFPIRAVESGPAAGAIAAASMSLALRHDRVLSFDMGGTTAKVTLIKDGVPKRTTDFEVARVYRFKKGSGLPIKLPVIEMTEIGAGGGSIASVDKMGFLKVGPESAGADPGPACYGRGGEDPTVTDADLVLGYLNPGYFLGGEMKLDVKRAQEAIRKKVAEPLGLDLATAAWGIHEIVDENMANSARILAVEKGEDLAAYSLMAFGGAGPVHAYWVAKRLGNKKIVCPYAAGVLSALGLTLAPLSFDFVRSYLRRLDTLDLDEINALYKELEEEGARLLMSAGAEREEIQVTRTCDMRYVRQGFEIVVPIPPGTLADGERERIYKEFEKEYEKLYFKTNPDMPIEALNWRLHAARAGSPIDLRRIFAGLREQAGEEHKGKRMVYLPEYGEYRESDVFDRYALKPNRAIRGPAIIEEKESTVVVGPDAYATIDEYFNVVIEMSG